MPDFTFTVQCGQRASTKSIESIHTPDKVAEKGGALFGSSRQHRDWRTVIKDKSYRLVDVHSHDFQFEAYDVLSDYNLCGNRGLREIEESYEGLFVQEISAEVGFMWAAPFSLWEIATPLRTARCVFRVKSGVEWQVFILEYDVIPGI